MPRLEKKENVRRIQHHCVFPWLQARLGKEAALEKKGWRGWLEEPGMKLTKLSGAGKEAG